MLWSCLDQPDLFVSGFKLPPFILFPPFFFYVLVLSLSSLLLCNWCSNLDYYYYFLFVSLWTVSCFFVWGVGFSPCVLLGQIPGFYLCLPAKLKLSLSKRRHDEVIRSGQHYSRSALFQCPWHTIVNRDKQHNRIYHVSTDTESKAVDCTVIWSGVQSWKSLDMPRGHKSVRAISVSTKVRSQDLEPCRSLKYTIVSSEGVFSASFHSSISSIHLLSILSSIVARIMGTCCPL